MMKRAGKPAGHDFGDNRVPGDGQKARECLTERPELDNEDTKDTKKKMTAFQRAKRATKTLFVSLCLRGSYFRAPSARARHPSSGIAPA